MSAAAMLELYRKAVRDAETAQVRVIELERVLRFVESELTHEVTCPSFGGRDGRCECYVERIVHRIADVLGDRLSSADEPDPLSLVLREVEREARKVTEPERLSQVARQFMETAPGAPAETSVVASLAVLCIAWLASERGGK